ncbi:MAG: hypothetical protein WA687_12570 [Solirubrobacterales bacterium]
MIRNLKTMGLALGGLLVLSALVASTASAQQGTLTADGPVTLTGEETPGSALLANAITAPIGSVTCDGTQYTGHTAMTHAETTAGAKHKAISIPAIQATITAHYATHCTAHIPVLGTRPATVTMNGCDYVLTLGQTTGGGVTFGATVHFRCPLEKRIEVHIYKTGSVGHPDADSICTLKIGEANNQGLTGGHVTGTGGFDDDLHLTGTLLNIHTEGTGSLCGTTTSETADLHVDVTIKGDDAVGDPTGITVTDP